MASGNHDSLVSIVELYVSCTKLENMDIFSKSDPFAVLFEGRMIGKQRSKMDKTEVIYDNCNPKVSATLIYIH